MKSKLLLILTATLLFSNGSNAATQTYGNLTVTEVRSIFDGDTFKVHISGLHPIIGQSISIRVNGVDTPEMRGKCDKRG